MILNKPGSVRRNFYRSSPIILSIIRLGATTGERSQCRSHEKVKILPLEFQTPRQEEGRSMRACQPGQALTGAALRGLACFRGASPGVFRIRPGAAKRGRTAPTPGAGLIEGGVLRAACTSFGKGL